MTIRLVRSLSSGAPRALATCAMVLIYSCSKADDLSPPGQPRRQAEAIQTSIDSARAHVSGSAPTRRDATTGPIIAMPPTAVGAPALALPAFPGSAHLYHLGSRDFFLDEVEALSLSDEQTGRLRVLQQTSSLDRAETRRKIEEAERHLWTLTATDAPDQQKIEAHVREIERLRADDRLAFIRAVGEGARLLTAAQRAVLVGEPRASTDAGAPPGDVPPDAGALPMPPAAGMRPM